MNIDHKNTVPETLNQSVINAIHGALKEEKVPASRRFLKVVLCTILTTALLGVPFFLIFKTQLSWIFEIALGIWILCLGFGFSLYFYPQPRLVVPGVWSPMIFARLLIASTLATLVQILLCPSFVFLESPIDWNPLEPVTQRLMSMGGMGFCMFFCGFVFSVLSGVVGLSSTWKVLSGSSAKSLALAAGILLLSQFPVLFVQIASSELRAFAPFWMLGLFLGLAVAAVFGMMPRFVREK